MPLSEPTHCHCGQALTENDRKRGLNQCLRCDLKEIHLPRTGSLEESVPRRRQMGERMNLGHPARGLAFIKHIETEETYRGSSIIIPDQARDKIAKQQFIVVAVGEPEWCEDDECPRLHDPLLRVDGEEYEFYHRSDVRGGDWVLCRNRSWAATPDPNIFVVRQADILGKFVEVTAPAPESPKRRPQPAP